MTINFFFLLESLSVQRLSDIDENYYLEVKNNLKIQMHLKIKY